MHYYQVDLLLIYIINNAEIAVYEYEEAIMH